jgi:UDP-N-acetylglucosamine--N-acetylmuramyl-(pentapeptide) pyrophosphoryl-undecaprenol N-acetylglucosamine transferase
MSTVVLSAGGTGGHLFPAQALAAELKRRGHAIVVMTDARAKSYGDAFPGTRIETVPSGTFISRSPVKLAVAGFEIIAGIAVAFAKLKRLRPSAVVGFGGYPSLPVMLAARLAGFPTAIHEQNAVLGRVNRLVAAGVRMVAASFPFARFAPEDHSRIAFTGNPVRPAVVEMAASVYVPPAPDGPVNLLVFGGSQGARALSEFVPESIAKLPRTLVDRLQIVQQCRPEDIDSVRAAYERVGAKANLQSFFTDMPQRMAAAHLVVARSGASTISELCVIGRPSILIPYPFATDDHQTANADVLAQAGAAWAIQQRDLSAAGLAALLMQIFADPAGLAAKAEAAKKIGHPDAAARLADAVEKLGRAA